MLRKKKIIILGKYISKRHAASNPTRKGKNSLCFQRININWHFLRKQAFTFWGHSHSSLLRPQEIPVDVSQHWHWEYQTQDTERPCMEFFPFSSPCPQSFNPVLPSSSFLVCTIMLMPAAGYNFTVPLCKWVKWCLNYIWLDERGLW